MVSDGEDGVILLGLRELGDEVEGDDFKWVCLGFWDDRCYQCSGELGIDLMALAFCTPPNVLYYILSKSRPPVPPLDQVRGPTDSWVSMYR